MLSLRIAGETDVSLTEGEPLVLACSVMFHQDGLHGKHVQLAWWRRGTKLVEQESDDSRVIVHQIVGASGVVAEVEIHPVKPSDSGRYYCRAEPKYQSGNHPPTILQEAWIDVKVSLRRPENWPLDVSANRADCILSVVPLAVFLSVFFPFILYIS